MIDRQGKAWGQTSLLYRAPHLQVHLLEIDAGGFCSEHRHTRKVNTFHIIRGRLEVRIWPSSLAQPDTTELEAGESMTIPVGVYHQFKAIENTTCLEIYEAAEIDEDIERRTTGGRQDA